MNPFKSYTFKWWQVSMLKLAMIAFGLAIGATFPDVFASWLPVLWVLFVVLSVYLMFVGFRQIRPGGSEARPRARTGREEPSAPARI